MEQKSALNRSYLNVSSCWFRFFGQCFKATSFASMREKRADQGGGDMSVSNLTEAALGVETIWVSVRFGVFAGYFLGADDTDDDGDEDDDDEDDIDVPLMMWFNFNKLNSFPRFLTKLCHFAPPPL